MPVDSTAEIMAKKLVYRPASLRRRDVFDLATVVELDRPSARRAVAAASHAIPLLRRRIDELVRGNAVAGEDAIAPLPGFETLPRRMFDVVRSALTEEPR